MEKLLELKLFLFKKRDRLKVILIYVQNINNIKIYV